jgi:tetratricopeptide (TPR) repeat protein
MKSIFKIVFLLLSVGIFAQQKKDFALPEGNSQFAKKEYAEAEANYRVSKKINPKRATASYNLGNAIYKQNQPAEAKFAYEKALETAKGKQQKHRAFHNLGNVFMKEKAYDKAVEAYKNALRNNPADEETRYNYALAKKMLKEDPPKGDDKKEDDKDQKDKDKEKNKDQKDNKDQNNKDQKNNNKENQPEDQKQNNPQPKPKNIPKDRMQNLLDAVNNDEKKVQEKVNTKKVKGNPVENEKDW